MCIWATTVKAIFFTKLNLSHRPTLGPLVFTIFLGGIAFALWQGPSYWWAIAYLVHFFIFSFGVGYGLHRIVAHQAAESPQIVVRLSALVGALAQVGSPVSWRTVHILHHAYSDGELDPHLGSRLGWRLILGYTIPPEKSSFVEVLLAARSVRDPFLIFLHKYYYLITVAYGLVCYGFFGLNGLMYLAILPMGLSFLSLGLLNYFSHSRFGYRNFETKDQSENIWWLWPLTFGENWHNNHHQKPREANFREARFEIDIIYFYFIVTKLFWKSGA